MKWRGFRVQTVPTFVAPFRRSLLSLPLFFYSILCYDPAGALPLIRRPPPTARQELSTFPHAFLSSSLYKFFSFLEGKKRKRMTY